VAIKDRNNRRLNRLGIVRLGHKETGTRKNGSTYTYPVQDDHFLLHDARDIEEFYHKKGISEVRELDVLLPYPDIPRNFPTWYQVWAGGVLVCQGDGEYVAHATPFTCAVSQRGSVSVRNAPGDTLIANGVAQVPFDWNGDHFAEGDHVPCPGAAKETYPHCAACRLSSVLKVMMADPALFRFGYYQISTGSGQNYDTIMGTLEAMPADRVNGVPFKLSMVERQTSYQDTDGQRKKTTKWFLQLEPDPEITRQLYTRQVSQMIGAPAPMPVLVAGERHGPDDIIYGEPPAPPPYAEDQTREPYEDEQPTGDPLLNGDFHGAPVDGDAAAELKEVQEAETSVIVPVPTPNGLTHANIVEQAQALAGYSSPGDVKTAMLHVCGNDWMRNTEWSLSAAWSELQAYAASKSAE